MRGVRCAGLAGAVLHPLLQGVPGRKPRAQRHGHAGPSRMGYAEHDGCSIQRETQVAFSSNVKQLGESMLSSWGTTAMTAWGRRRRRRRQRQRHKTMASTNGTITYVKQLGGRMLSSWGTVC